jgi:TPR repeat protein
LEKAADQNYLQAMALLGQCYIKGDGCKQDYDKSVQWFIKISKLGDKQSNFYLESIIKRGLGSVENSKDVFKWLSIAAERGSADAQYCLGVIYVEGNVSGRDFEGDGITKNYKEAVKWLRKSAEQDNIEAQCYLGCFYVIHENNPEESNKWLKKIADKNDDKLYYKIGKVFYSFGKFELAQEWLQKAADQGHEEGKKLLAVIKKSQDELTRELQKYEPVKQNITIPPPLPLPDNFSPDDIFPKN